MTEHQDEKATSDTHTEIMVGPNLHLTDYDGPLDLLLTLIEQNEIDIMDIPIAELTRQYMAYLDALDELDIEQASEFLLVAADLLRLKSKLLMPKPSTDDKEAEDPRQELVFRLLAYRRTRYMALYLRTQVAINRYMAYRMRETPAHLGLELDRDKLTEEEASEKFEISKLQKAIDRLTERNKLRYQDVSDKLKTLTGREKISLKERIVRTFEAIVRRGKCFFKDLFPRTDSITSRVNGFLAVLELIRQNRIEATQDDPEDEIHLFTLRPGDSESDYHELSKTIDSDYR